MLLIFSQLLIGFNECLPQLSLISQESRCGPLIFYLASQFLNPYCVKLPTRDTILMLKLFFFLLQQVVSAVRAGVNPSGNLSNQTSLWDLSSSFFFAGTVITTIGRKNGF
ncbi:hypothetical protein GOODEAATRI_024287 [Goodea atripinnis]|uniref:Potassium channel domain-containing protein n=1 Tax=Goodea atripinnis TaxID=208336 RepID=A0ABV0NMT8_9TELE